MNSLGRDGGGAARYPHHRALVDDTSGFYTVGQVADLLGVQPAFLRRLDSCEVVSPSRSPGGQRRYSRNDIHHVDEVSKLMDDGMTLAGAKRIIEMQAVIDDLRRQLAEAMSTAGHELPVAANTPGSPRP